MWLGEEPARMMEDEAVQVYDAEQYFSAAERLRNAAVAEDRVTAARLRKLAAEFEKRAVQGQAMVRGAAG